jgi:hypothetical protein
MYIFKFLAVSFLAGPIIAPSTLLLSDIFSLVPEGMPSWRGAQFKKKTQGQLYLCLLFS